MKKRRFRLLACGATLALAAGTLALAAPGAEAGTPMVSDPTTLVDTFLGTGSGGDTVGDVDMFPGASMPFGMVAWSPDTPSRPASGGYAYDDSSTIGLSVTHVSGAGCNIEGNLPILPTTGAIPADPQSATEPFSHDDEKASPGSYSMKLGADGEMSADLAATTRTGIGTFGFPATTGANLIFKAGDSQNGDTTANISIDGDHEVSGSVASGHFCGDQQLPEPLYYAVSFDRPFASFGTYSSHGTVPGSRTDDSGHGSGGWVTFDTTTARQVHMKVGISYVSEANAKANLSAEDPGWDEGRIAKKAHDTWRDLLSKIQIGGGTHDHQVQFYTALYHALLVPTTFSDANGQYEGFDLKTHRLARGQDAQYTNFSGWDIYRSEIPLLATLLPEQTSAMVQSMVNDEAQGGWLPKWPNANTETGVMNGDAADPIIAEAYTFGARDFDTKAALKAMVKGATQVPTQDQLGQGWYEERPQLADYQRLGYVPNDSSTNNSAVTNGASETLEYALDDFSIAQFAHDTGAGATYRTFLDRSQNWTKLFNTGSGFLQPRDADGNFPSGNPVTAGLTDFGQSGFQEGNAAQYAWSVPQDLGGLITAMGGDAAANRRLDSFFSSFNSGPNDPTYWAGNEIDLLAPWVYDYTGEAYKTQATVHKLIDAVYSDTPGGEPGNDDLGAMSSWYVWSALGMYPETPGTPVLALGSPLFPRIRLDLGGRTVEVNAPGTSASSFYVRDLAVNGHRTSRDWLSADDVTGHGRPLTLDYTTGATPNISWGARSADRPPSYPAGPARFPVGVTPVDMTTSPAAVTVATGSSADTTMSLDVGAGSEVTPAKPITSVSWSASPPAGVTVSPASGTAPVGPDGTAQVKVSVSAAADAPQGFVTVPVALSAKGQSTALPTLSFPVSVVGTGDTATACTTLGDTNTDQGLAQHEVGGDGATQAQTVGGQPARTTVPLVTGDLNMYFQLDKRLAFDTPTTTTFTIAYYDSGTDSWSLQYDATGSGSAYTNALRVTNQDSNTWKTATVAVKDSGFAERENGSSDFRIASASPVSIHRVTTQISGPGVLPMDLCPAG